MTEAAAVSYEEFGAIGDGKHDDLPAIIKAHEFANKERRPVRAKDGATYYIGGSAAVATIKTSTDFGSANFIIDDRDVADLRADIFHVVGREQALEITGVTSLQTGQTKIGISLPACSLVEVYDENRKRYIRHGLNASNGTAQNDIFLADRNGNIDPTTPIIWDFAAITSIKAYPLDAETLTLRGGHFTTIANQAESKYTYYGRGININRSNVLIEGLHHDVTGEGEHGAPYSGFINVVQCANVTVKDCTLTAHKTFCTLNDEGLSIAMGSYDLLVTRAVNVRFVNCKQTNDIKDNKYWGIFGSNLSKNLAFEGCTLSRFDAHMGVVHTCLRNSTLGYMGINAIGFGTFLVENCTVYGRNFINLRSDYGSTWKGEFVIRNSVFIPACGAQAVPVLFGGANNGDHDFGYTCYMPETITIDGLRIEDKNHPPAYKGPAIFANFTPAWGKEGFTGKFEYVLPKKVVLKNITVSSGKRLRRSDNEYMFNNVKLVEE